MKEIVFPKFNIPKLTSKQITPEVYDEWNNLNARYLSEAGFRNKRRDDPTRVPVSERFILK